MKIPPYLKSGDTIGIVAPAGIIKKGKIDYAVKVLNGWDINVKIGAHVLDKDHYFAGTDEHRTSDFQQMLDDETIKAIFCARGGYGTIRIIDNLDFSNFIKKPKWIIGFSDITILHVYLNNYLKTSSVHGVMPINFADNEEANLNLKYLKKALWGELIEYNIKPNILNKTGIAKGELIGGNLSVLYGLRGTKFDFNPKGKILFVEEIGEYLYQLDRMLMNFKLSGVFDEISGLIVGEMSDMKDTEASFANSAFHVVSNLVSEYSFPVIYGFPAGHSKINRALVFGSEVQMEITSNNAIVKYLA
ncbi:MAG: LD-carboxypeptidase [Chlorobi bacterium]|nr:LD-carboxypeptidase [Chlorobiota bacterium]